MLISPMGNGGIVPPWLRPVPTPLPMPKEPPCEPPKRRMDCAVAVRPGPCRPVPDRGKD